MRGVYRLLLVVGFLVLSFQSVYGVCTYSGSGNWDVLTGESCYVNDTSITLNGNLTVWGSLTLDNVTLYINSSSRGEFGINVTYNATAGVGGTLIVANSTNLTALDAANNWFFYVEDNAQGFNMTDSYMSDVGWQPPSGSLPAGMYFKVDNIQFVNNTVYSQVAFITAHNSTIRNNRFLANNADAVVGLGALRLEDSDDTYVGYNFINATADKGYGLFLKYVQRANIVNNTIYTYGQQTSPAIFAEFSDTCTFRNNTMYSLKYQSVWFRSSSNNFDIDTSNLVEGKPLYYYEGTVGTVENISAGALYLDFVTDSKFKNITILDADNVMLSFVNNVTLEDVFIKNGSADLLSIWDSDNVYIYNYTGMWQPSVTSGDRRIVFGVDSGSTNITLIGCSLESGAGGTLAIRLRASQNIFVQNCTVKQGSSTYQNLLEVKAKGTNVRNATFKDTQFVGTAKLILDNNAGWLKFINATLTTLETRLNTYAEIYYYLDVYANDTVGNPLENVNVSAYDVNGTLHFTDLTKASGYIDTQTLISYNQTYTNGTIYFSPYNITGVKSGYTFDNSTVNLTTNKLAVLTGTPTSDVAPSVTLNSPSDNTYTNNATVVFNTTGRDDAALVNMTLYGNFTGTWAANSTTAVSGTEATTTWALTLGDGHYIWNVLACDNSSQCSYASQNYSVFVDTVAPTTTINSPVNQVLNQDYYFGNITVSESPGSAIMALNATNYTMSCSGTVCTYNATSLASGNYTLEFWATDRAGNMAYNGTYWVYLNTSTASGGSAASSDYLLTFVLRDNVKGGGTGANLSVYVGGTQVATYNVLETQQYGRITLNLTPYSPSGKKIDFELYGPSRVVVYLSGIRLTYGGKEIGLSWTCSKTHPDMRCKIYSARKIVLAHPFNITGTTAGVNATSNTIGGTPEVRIRNSGLVLSKTFNVSQGETITINATVENVGPSSSNDSYVSLLINGVNVQNSTMFNLSPGENTNVSFSYTVDYAGKNYVKIQVRVVPGNGDGESGNNMATRYLIRKYPYFFFTDFSQTPASGRLSEEPYATWYSDLQNAAQSAYSVDYSNTSLQEADKAINAMAMALYYQITGNESYANKTMEALQYIGNGMLDSDTQWIWANRSNTTGNYGWEANGNTYPMATAMKVSIGYAYAYNWVRNYMENYDSTYGTAYTDNAADGLYRVLADLYLLLREVNAPNDGYPTSGNSGVSFGGDDHLRRIGAVGALGTGALALLDYDGKYLDLEGSPEEWITFVVRDLAVDSQAGFWQPALDVHSTKDGYYMGGEYLQYFEPSVAYFMKTYYDTFGTNLGSQYPLLDGFAMFLPYTVMPNGMKNYVTAWYGVYQRQILLAETYPDSSFKKKLQYWYLNVSRVAYNDKGFLTKDTIIPKYMLLPVYNKSAETSGVDKDPSYISGKPSMAVLRSGFSKNDWYAYFKVINEEYYSATGQMSADFLTFDIWAKGAYLVPDSGEPRFTKISSSVQRYRGEAQTIGHTTVVVNVSGLPRAVARWHTGLVYPEKNFNRAYLRFNFSSPQLDFFEGYMYVKSVRNASAYSASTETLPDAQKFNWTRGVLLVGDDYLVEYDFFNNTNNEYNLIIPLGSTEGTSGSVAYDGSFASQLDNRVFGNLTVGTTRVVWFNDTAGRVVMREHSFSADKVEWETFSETNNLETSRKIVNLSIYFPSSLNISQNVSVMHYGPYDGDYDFWHPYLKVRVPANKMLVVYNAYDTAADKYSKAAVTLQGGDSNDYGLALVPSSGGYYDMMHVSDGEQVTVSYSSSSYKTDATFGLVRVNTTAGKPQLVFLRNVTQFNYSGIDFRAPSVLPFPVKLDYSWGTNITNITLEADFEGSYNVTLWVPNSSQVTSIKRNGQTFTNWGVVDQNHIWLIFSGASLATYDIVVAAESTTSSSSSSSGGTDTSSGGGGGGGGGGGATATQTDTSTDASLITGVEVSIEKKNSTHILITVDADTSEVRQYTLKWTLYDKNDIMRYTGEEVFTLPEGGRSTYTLYVPYDDKTYRAVAVVMYNGHVLDTAEKKLRWKNPLSDLFSALGSLKIPIFSSMISPSEDDTSNVTATNETAGGGGAATNETEGAVPLPRDVVNLPSGTMSLVVVVALVIGGWWLIGRESLKRERRRRGRRRR